jgi:hypothetical protein
MPETQIQSEPSEVTAEAPPLPGAEPADEATVTWRPTRGPVVKFIAWMILLAIAAMLVTMIALVVAAHVR